MDGEQYQRVGETADDPTTADPIEIALEAVKTNPTPDSPARRLLFEQELLIKAQRAQLGRQRWRDLIVTALGVCVLAIAGLFVWDASRANGVVVEPFAVPPDMVQQGLSGPVLATQFLDKLTGMQAQTESLRAHSTYANDWSDNIAVEIPNTGVSIGELRSVLRQWLGHQTRLSGEVFRLPGGRIAVTTRVGASPGTRTEGTEAELDALLQQGAEAVYAETQPYRYAAWLTRQKRLDEAKAVRLKLITGKDLNDRLWGYNGLGASSTDVAERQRWYAAALKLRPDFAPVISNRALSWSGTGQEEEAYRGYGDVLRNAASARRELEPGRAEGLLISAGINRAVYVGDMRKAAELSERKIGVPASTLNMAGAPLNAISQFTQTHDLAGARRLIEENGLSTPQAMAERLDLMGPDAEVDSWFATAIGDWNAAAVRLERVLADIGGYKRDARALDPTAQTRTYLAVAQARSGRAVVGRATIAPTALECAYCVRARGTVEAYAGDQRAADRWFTLATQMSPSLPAAHNDWAEAYLVRHDPAKAIVQAKLAVKKGPRWAEPRKFWGDALMMQGKPADAARKYADAVKLAPGWGALHLALGRAQAASGRSDKARESFRAAAGLDLDARDRAEVNRLLASR